MKCFLRVPSPEKEQTKKRRKTDSDECLLDLKRLDELFAKFMFACKEPFSIVENKHFQNFISALCPAYKIPGRKKTSSTLLDECYETLLKENRSDKKENATLLLDAWTNNSSDTKYMTVMAKVRSSGKELLIKAFDVTAYCVDADLVSELTLQATEFAETTFNLNIDSYLTDNDYTMRRSGKDSMLIDYGCFAHQGNLFMKDVHNKKLYNKVHHIMINFKSFPRLHANLLNRGGNKLYTKGATR